MHRVRVVVVLTHIWPIISRELPICLLSQHQTSHDATRVCVCVRVRTHTHMHHTHCEGRHHLQLTAAQCLSPFRPMRLPFLRPPPCCVGSVFCLVDVFRWGKEVTHLWPKLQQCHTLSKHNIPFFMWFGLSSAGFQGHLKRELFGKIFMETPLVCVRADRKKGFVLASPFLFVAIVCVQYLFMWPYPQKMADTLIKVLILTFQAGLFTCGWINVHLFSHYTGDGIFLHFLTFVFWRNRFKRSSPLSSAHTYDSPLLRHHWSLFW